MITMYTSYIIGCNDANKGLKLNHTTTHQQARSQGGGGIWGLSPPFGQNTPTLDGWS